VALTDPSTDPSTEPSTDELVGLFFGVMNRMKQHFSERSAEFDLSFAQAMAVRELEEPLSMGELAERLGCDASNVTGIVDRLEERELVERQILAGDRRVKRLVLTDAGRALRAAHQERLAEDVPLAASLSPEDRRVLADLFRRVAE
jgi:DNA-binding MarR family transcriptional regulator